MEGLQDLPNDKENDDDQDAQGPPRAGLSPGAKGARKEEENAEEKKEEDKKEEEKEEEDKKEEEKEEEDKKEEEKEEEDKKEEEKKEEKKDEKKEQLWKSSESSSCSPTIRRMAIMRERMPVSCRSPKPAVDASKISLWDYKLKTAPDTLFYIPNFISGREEDHLLDKIINAPKPKWTQLRKRRIQNWGGIVGKRALIPDNDIPEWLQCFMTKVSSISGIFPSENLPNHVLINEYLPGQGIMPHEDGPAFYPQIGIVSLGSYATLDFYSHLRDQQAILLEKKHFPDSVCNLQTSLEERYVGSALLEPRSLIIVRDQMYDHYLHGISERTHDLVDEALYNSEILQHELFKCGDPLKRDTRVSVSIRNVPKVAKVFSVR